jgi:hypothetical protein
VGAVLVLFVFLFVLTAIEARELGDQRLVLRQTIDLERRRVKNTEGNSSVPFFVKALCFGSEGAGIDWLAD